MDYEPIIEEIRKLPIYREITCKDCDWENQVPLLQIYATCLNCGKNLGKMRAFEPFGGELEDLISEVQSWLENYPKVKLSPDKPLKKIRYNF